MRPHPDRLFPPDPGTRALARELHAGVAGLPVLSLHGHVDAGVLAADRPFDDPASLLVTPDHYVTRLLHAHGVPLADLGVRPLDGGAPADPRSVWHTFCRHWPLLRGTASQLWLEAILAELFGIDDELRPEVADATYDAVAAQLGRPELSPRALYDRFGLEVLATTDPASSDLAAHRALADDPTFTGSVIPTFRPDAVIDPTRAGWAGEVDRLCQRTGRDPTYRGYLAALADRRQAFVALGARSTDHAPAVPVTADLDESEAAACFDGLRAGTAGPGDAAAFCAHMLTVMATMSCDDGLVMQLHPGVRRDHHAAAARFGPDVGADFPVPVSFTDGLRPLLERCGEAPGFRLVVYTVDETTWSRELAPMASYWPALRLGAPWWFLDAPDAMARFFAATVESAGYANFAGFVDDTRAFCSIGARHDTARRAVCAHLATMVAAHRLSEAAAAELARDFVYDRPRATYGL